LEGNGGPGIWPAGEGAWVRGGRPGKDAGRGAEPHRCNHSGKRRRKEGEEGGIWSRACRVVVRKGTGRAGQGREVQVRVGGLKK
jgi:hypothetical protein